MAVLICRACGAESRYWQPGIVCPHCGAASFNRLTEARVCAELGALEYLFSGKENERTPATTKRQLELFGRK